MTVESVTKIESTETVSSTGLPKPYPQLDSNILNLFLLTGKNAIITGGARGIGYVVSEAYLQAGLSKLAIMDYDKNDEGIDKLKKRFPNSEITYYSCDVRSNQQVYDTINTIYESFGTIDVFVANAGIAWTSGALIDPPTDDDWHNVMNVDLNGVYYCAKIIGQIFKKQQYGSLVMTASMSGHIVNIPQLQAAYNTAKAGVVHLGRSLAIEWPWARVNTVSPGYIGTELSDFIAEDMKQKWYSMIPKGRQGHPRELCGAYLYLASDASTYTTGTDIKVDGGYCAV